MPKTQSITPKKLEEILSEIRKLEDYRHIIYYMHGMEMHPWYDVDVDQVSIRDKE